MAAEALIVEDAYQKGYADAMADMRKKKEQRRQREQAKKARRWYFIKQKACGLAMLAITVLAVWATEGDITIAFITVPLGLTCIFSKEMLIMNDYYFTIDVVGHINTRDKAQALELRRRMLKIFNPELSATLVYEYGGFKRVIDCRAYGEPKILKKEVLYEFDLQIECLNPFWREEEETKEDIASWVAAWHFPCVIEKDSTKSMIYGYRAESVIVDCYNEGDVSTGMRIRFTALGTVSNPILLNVDTEEFIQINATMKTGDVIEINTKYGSKGAKLIRDGVETDYFRYIDVDSTFMQLAIGDNMFRYDAASGVNSLEVSIFYSKEFLGV